MQELSVIEVADSSSWRLRVFPEGCVESIACISNTLMAQSNHIARETYFAKSIMVASCLATVILLRAKRYPVPGKASITQILTELLGMRP